MHPHRRTPTFAEKRGQAIAEFQMAPPTQVFFLTHRTGGAGVTLTSGTVGSADPRPAPPALVDCTLAARFLRKLARLCASLALAPSSLRPARQPPARPAAFGPPGGPADPL
jgi:hypothetical protein